MPKIEVTNRYVHVRIKDPNKFVKIRTKDIGQKGYSKLRVGRLKGGTKWIEQSYLISVKGIKQQRPQEVKLLWNLVYKREPKKFFEIINRFIKIKGKQKSNSTKLKLNNFHVGQQVEFEGRKGVVTEVSDRRIYGDFPYVNIKVGNKTYEIHEKDIELSDGSIKII